MVKNHGLVMDLRAWLQKPGHRLLDLIGLLMAGYFVTIAWQLAQHADAVHLFLLAIFTFMMLRILFEITLNRKKIPTIPAGVVDRRKIAELLKKHAAAREGHKYTVIDLGSGGGELSRHIGHSLPEARVIGIELSSIPYKRAVLYQKIFGPKNVEYVHGDILAHDCSGVDAAVMFLDGRFTPVVGEKLARELKPGAMVLSHSFKLQDSWQPFETVTFHAPFKETVFVYYQGMGFEKSG